MKKMIIRPDNWAIELWALRPGFFVFNGELCIKSEYNHAYCSSGEYFWGGTNDRETRNSLMVTPVEVVWEEID